MHRSKVRGNSNPGDSSICFRSIYGPLQSSRRAHLSCELELLEYKYAVLVPTRNRHVPVSISSIRLLDIHFVAQLVGVVTTLACNRRGGAIRSAFSHYTAQSFRQNQNRS